MSVKARVFISCGQKKDTEEFDLAQKVKSVLKDKGFDSYVAVTHQTLKDLKSNIFRQLRNSEYFLFIDLKRELLKNGTYRGSLFSHQELALASYLDLETIAFQEKGVEKMGILPFIQVNAEEFSNRNTLPELIVKKIKEKKWKNDWKNQIVLDDVYNNTAVFPDGQRVEFFHIRVLNLNYKRDARSCYGYLELFEINGKKSRPKTVELKWSGYTKPNANILSSSYRDLDTFFVRHDKPHEAMSNSFTDSGRYKIVFRDQGKYILRYRVISANFPSVVADYNFQLVKPYEKMFSKVKQVIHPIR